ncbi:MAG: hypothetical protein GC168_01685 [Candidatus Hydrogenedens sp.]|nr:hypothetical protein [Candidatus Hydrogenedens sp.]
MDLLRHRWFWPCILVLGVGLLFGISLGMRAPWLGMLPDREEYTNADIVLAMSVRNVNEWLADTEKPLLSRFIVYCTGPSVEVGDGMWRMREIAYFPLSWMPLYAVGRMTGSPVTVQTAQLVNMGYQFLAALGLALLVATALRPAWPRAAATIAGLAASSLVLFLPGPYFYYFYTYFPDMVVVPVFVWAILLELWRDDAAAKPLRRGIVAAQAVLLFAGVLSEWLFIPFTFALLLKRALLGEFGATLAGWVKGVVATLGPGAAGMAVFLLYWVWNQALYELFVKFIIHTGTNDHGPSLESYVPVFWFAYVRWALGWYAPQFLWAAIGVSTAAFLAAAAARHRGAAIPPNLLRIIVALFLTGFPMMLYSLLLRAHEAENNYESAKFAVPAAAALTLLPAVALQLRKRRSALQAAAAYASSAAVSLIAAGWIAVASPGVPAMMHVGTDRLQRIAKELAPEQLEPDVLFASFIRNNGDAINSSVVFGQMIRPYEDLPIFLPRFAGVVPYTYPLIQAFLRPGYEMGLTPEIDYTPPAHFTVGLLYPAEGPVPEALAPLAPYARQRDSSAYRMLVLDNRDLARFYVETGSTFGFDTAAP